MGEIKELDLSLINKIAAGEVIERPASVVKELIENSLDAGAKKIEVHIEEGGIKSITVQDNGSGMSREDLPISVKRHTTSKINTIDDLYNIKTLGFRGEALSSIAAVSFLTITSKRNDAPIGHQIHIENGQMENILPVMCKDGTRIEVRQLFNNVPVRKKYLRGTETEWRRIQKIIIAYSLANTNVSFSLFNNGKEELTTQNDNEMNTIASLFGHEIAKQLISVGYENKGINLTGYISKPTYARKTKSHQYLFVNGRNIQNYTITKAIYKAHDTLLFGDKHPIAILNISISPKEIDVNIHPTKAEIKFIDEQEIFRTVYNGIKKTLYENDILHGAYMQEKNYFEKNPFYEFGSIKFQKALKQTILEGETKDEVLFSSRKTDRKFKILGRVHGTYIIAETDEGILLVDQHAAHEKILYEKFKKELENKDIKKQDLLKPVIIEATKEQEDLILQSINLLSELGFNLEQFGPRTFRLTTLPSVFGRTQPKEMLYNLIDELEEGEAETLEKIKQERIIMRSCKSAIKAHDNLEMDEVITLLNELQSLEQPFTCPHGRPTMIHYSIYDLEKLFMRKV